MKNQYPIIFLLLAVPFFGQAQNESFQKIQLDLSESNVERSLLSTDTEWTNILLCGLTPGISYAISAVSDMTTCNVQLNQADELTHELNLIATSECEEVKIQKSCSGKSSIWLSVNAPNQPIDFPEGEIEIQQGLSAEDLIRDVLIGNNCNLELNVSHKGDPQQFGTFSNAMDVIGFESGVIISSGVVHDATGPNNSNSSGTNVPGSFFDDDLSDIANNNTNDVAVIEFDFTPLSDKVQFRYVFASEEYCEFVNSSYNDVFGFFISGPGINGTQNIAQVPNTNQVVNIDNVNHIVNTNYFNSNSYASCQAVTNMEDIQFDGYTEPFIAEATVIPCETYHIKLAIADVGDGIYDSAVFLEAGSFDVGDLVAVNPMSDIVQSAAALEGCNNGYFLFDRSCSNDISQPVTLTIEVLPTGTAVEGIDYEALPPTFTIPAGVLSDSFPVTVFDDGLPEGDETIVIQVTGQYPCYKPTATMVLSEKVPIVAVGESIEICESGQAVLLPTIESGLEPYTYLWDSGLTDQSQSLLVDTTTLVTVEITDVCANKDTAEFDIVVTPNPKAEINGGGVLCDEIDSEIIELSFEGSPPWDIEIFKDGVNFFSKSYTSATSSFNVNEAGIYEIGIVSSRGCNGQKIGQAIITNTTLDADYNKTDVSCNGDSDGIIDALPNFGSPPYQFHWQEMDDSLATIQLLKAGNYAFTVTDQDGCTVMRQVEIEEPDSLLVEVVDIQGVSCYFPQGGAIDIQYSGGTDPVSFIWNNNQTDQNNSQLAAGLYAVTLTDAHDCKTMIEAEVLGDFEHPILAIAPPDVLTCYDEVVQLSGLGSSSGADFVHQWSTTTGQIISGDTGLNPYVNAAGIYSLTTTNTINGCESDTSVVVQVDQVLPEIQLNEPIELNCTDTIVEVFTHIQEDDYQYQWFTPNGHVVNSPNQYQVEVDAQGSYYLEVTNERNGCKHLDSVEVSAITTYPESAQIDASMPSCLGGDGGVSISNIRGGSEPFMYSYDGGVSFHSSPVHQQLHAGHYGLVIQDVYGCEYKESVYLPSPIPPTLNAVSEYIIELGDSIQLETFASVFESDLQDISWYPIPDTTCVQCLTPYAKPLQSTIYSLVITDSLHCQDSAMIKVHVQEPDVYIPNVFAPGSILSENNRFKIFYNPRRVKSILNFRIYDRWGNNIYAASEESDTDLMGWAGDFRGQDMPPGVYIYAAEVEFINGKRVAYNGDVTLVR